MDEDEVNDESEYAGKKVIRMKLKIEATLHLGVRMRAGGKIKGKARAQVMMTELASDKGKGGDERMGHKMKWMEKFDMNWKQFI